MEKPTFEDDYMQTKVCRSCEATKQISEFYKGRAECKPCNIAKARAWQEENKERHLATKAAWREKNTEKIRETAKRWSDQNQERKKSTFKRWMEQNKARDIERKLEWAAKNPDRVREIARRAYENNKPLFVAHSKKRKAAMKSSVPLWDKELDQLVFYEAYRLAKQRTDTTGTVHHVDHIVPLRGKTVCGLHNAYNLAVIPARENATKSNRWWPQMPD